MISYFIDKKARLTFFLDFLEINMTVVHFPKKLNIPSLHRILNPVKFNIAFNFSFIKKNLHERNKKTI